MRSWILAALGILFTLMPAASALNQAPVALFEPSFLPPESSIVSKTVEGYNVFYTFELNASLSYDPDGNITGYRWERMKQRFSETNAIWEIIGRNKTIYFDGRNYTEGWQSNYANCFLVFIRLTVIDDKGAMNSTERNLCSGIFDEKRLWMDEYKKNQPENFKNISGFVMDAYGRPVRNAYVRVDYDPYTSSPTYTDEMGFYSFAGLDMEQQYTYKVRVEYDGNITFSPPFNVSRDIMDYSVNISLNGPAGEKTARGTETPASTPSMPAFELLLSIISFFTIKYLLRSV
ncbi:MAG: carboxypeptidase regulatory-like domain-containing protein [Candidatus Methanoperedens sp.]